MKKNTKWDWTEQHQHAFEGIKRNIAEIESLKHYDPKAETILTTDASTKGLGATLWQKVTDGRRPVAFASRYLSDSEKKYAPNELELLAIKWAIEHFKYQLMGRKFTVETDHKALLPIFNKNCIEKQYSSRLIRWRQRLLPYNFEVVYRPGRTMGLTDVLSRSPHGPPPPDRPQEEESYVIAQVNKLNWIKNKTLADQLLASLTNKGEKLTVKTNQLRPWN